MLHLRTAVGQRAHQIFNRVTKRPGLSNPAARPAFFSHLASSNRLNNDLFARAVLPMAGMRALYSTQTDADKKLPVVDLRDYSADDATKREAFVQKLGKSLKDYGFVAVAGHDINPELASRYYGNLKNVFALPMIAKKAYAHPELGFNRGYYPLGQERKADKPGGDKKFADLNEKWHIGAVANVFPEGISAEVSELQETAPQMYSAMEKTSTKIVSAIGQFLDSVGLQDRGYLKSTMVNAKRKPIGSHLLRSIHYPPVKPEQRSRFTEGEPVIRAGEHDDLNLITLLPESIEPGLEILRRKDGKNDRWMAVHSQEGHLICNSGKMLSLISGGEINHKGDITKQGLLPSIRHRVVGDPATLDKARYSTPFFVTPHYDKPLRNLRTGEELTTGEFLYRRLQGHGSLDPSVSYETFRKNADQMLIKEDDLN